jgi:hypothetical protein
MVARFSEALEERERCLGPLGFEALIVVVGMLE